MELGFWLQITWYMIKINQSTELKKSSTQCVLLCPSYLFLCILTVQVQKDYKKKKKKTEACTLLNEMHTAKQMHVAALRQRIILLALH